MHSVFLHVVHFIKFIPMLGDFLQFHLLNLLHYLVDSDVYKPRILFTMTCAPFLNKLHAFT